MAQKNVEKNTYNPAKELDNMLNNYGYQIKIQEWWFDSALYQENDPNQIRTELKRYYAFTQIFYHENFRKSNVEIDQCLKALILKIEHEERYRTCQKKDKRLMNLVLGSAYRRLGQFKAERYQPAEAEHAKANYYLEQDTSFFELADSGNNDAEMEDFVIMLLFLLNKAKYFRDIAEQDSLRVDACYWRAIMLFQEIRNKIEEQCNKGDIDGILARIYVSAWLNIAQIYRFQQEYELTATECENLISFCINSLENQDEKNAVRNILNKLPKTGDAKEINGFSVKGFIQENRNKVDYLFEDYILQALLQLGISYRDRVDFNGSRDGNYWVRQAMAVFLVLGIVDCIKDYSASASIEKITNSLTALQSLTWNSMDVPEPLIVRIRDLCSSNASTGTKQAELKNADAQNNLAVCLKKLNYYTASITILNDDTLEGNKFAEYNLYKSYLDSGMTEDMKSISQYYYKENPVDTLSAKDDPAGPKTVVPVYIYPEEPEKSNRKWLFLYARYLFTLKKYDEAEKLFSLIRSGRTIQWDSLELKAAYLEAQCQIKREKYLAAITSLRNIHESLLKLDSERSKRRREIRTEIDLGWCLIVEDRYQEALKVYRDLLIYLVQGKQIDTDSPEELTAIINTALEQLKNNIISMQESDTEAAPPYAIKWHTVSSLSQKELLHNLYDCWTYLNMDNPDKYPQKISILIREICLLIEDSDVYIRFLDCLRNMSRLKKEPRPDGGIKMCGQWNELSNAFDEILKCQPMDYLTYSCWVISKVNYCMQLFEQNQEFFLPKRQLLLGLVSSATAITMKCYIEVARIVLAGDGRFLDICKKERPGQKMDEDGQKMAALERSFLELFCHVRLLENGTNQAFMKLMTNESFHSIKLVTRAKLLACIVDLYGDILRVKTQLRVTYTDLEDFENKAQNDKAAKNVKPVICQYTRLGTLKAILPKTSRTTMVESDKDEPRFRMSNAARMNDASEGAMFKKICENITKLSNTSDKSETHDEVIKKYIDNSAGYKDIDDISSFDSDVYIASFSMNRNNFGLWSNYADKEKGCIIGFDQSFFDLVDKNYYSILDDELEENALYRIVYVDEHQLLAENKDLVFKSFNASDKNEIPKMDADTIKACIPNILKKLEAIESMLQDSNNQITSEAAGVVRAFIVDRLNEIRFLFKSVSYVYEEEVRMLRCSQDPEVADTGSSPVPWLYINVEKKLDNLTLILGSKVELTQVRELSVWAKSTGRVKQVLWSGLNRL